MTGGNDEIALRKIEEGEIPDDGHGYRAKRAREITSGTEYIVGLGKQLVPPGATANIIVRPTNTIRIRRLVIDSDTAEDFMVIDLKIGKNSQLMSPMEIPASFFSERNAIPLKLQFHDVCHAEMDIMVTVRNANASYREFKGAVVCEVV